MNDEVPDEGDFDANRHRGEFDDITPEDFIRGMGNPPGWLPSDEINRMRHEIPIPYVVVVPVRTDDLGRVAQIGSLLRVTDDGGIERTLIAGRVLYHESLREAVARNVAKDLGDIALPQLPISLQPFTDTRPIRLLRSTPTCDRAVLRGADRRRLQAAGRDARRGMGRPVRRHARHLRRADGQWLRHHRAAGARVDRQVGQAAQAGQKPSKLGE